ncbi:NEDD4-binding protein 1 [Bienertia sinuspersici]
MSILHYSSKLLLTKSLTDAEKLPKCHLALKASLSNHRHPHQVEEERLAVVEELRLVESRLEEESVALKKKEDELLKENFLTTLKATVHATNRCVDELEAVPMCSIEEMELFEEQERKLLKFQSSLDSSEWIM